MALGIEHSRRTQVIEIQRKIVVLRGGQIQVQVYRDKRDSFLDQIEYGAVGKSKPEEIAVLGNFNAGLKRFLLGWK